MRPLSRVFDGFSDQHLRRRINGQHHEAARVDLSWIKAPEVGGDDGQDWANVTHPEELSVQELHLVWSRGSIGSGNLRTLSAQVIVGGYSP